MKKTYIERNFSPASLRLISKAEEICNEYSEQGYELTLRQLYYQFVARGLIDNKQSEYKRLGSVINDARLAGLIDWEHITDRTRNAQLSIVQDSLEQTFADLPYYYSLDMWKGQENYVEVWGRKGSAN